MIRLILGPVAGAVTDTSAKIWVYAGKDDESELCCQTYQDADYQVQLSDSPVLFTQVSESVHTVAGISAHAYVANIAFPTGSKRVYYRIEQNGQPMDGSGLSSNILDRSVNPVLGQLFNLY